MCNEVGHTTLTQAFVPTAIQYLIAPGPAVRTLGHIIRISIPPGSNHVFFGTGLLLNRLSKGFYLLLGDGIPINENC